MSDFETRTIKIGEKQVNLDPSLLDFNEQTLSAFLEKEAAWYNYYGQCVSDAEYLMQRSEHEYDVIYSERFKEHKESGCSDKLAESNSKADPDVQEAKVTFLAAKHKVRLLQQHLRAWDRAHENAQSRGHFLRKEMDKLNSRVYGRDNTNLDLLIDDIIKSVDTGNL